MKKLFKMILLLWLFSISSFAQDTWTVAGVSSIFGSEWAPTDTSNDMKSEDGVVFTLTKKDVSLSAGIVYEYKVVKNHSWDNESYGQDGGEPNKTFSVPQDGLYDLTITFNTNTKELSELLIFIQSEDAWTVAGVSSVFGSEWTPTDTSNDMMSEDGVVFTLTKKDVNLSAGVVYEYKVVKNHSWNNESYGQDGGEPNKTFSVGLTGLYNLTIIFNANTKEVNEQPCITLWTEAGNVKAFNYVGSLNNWDSTFKSYPFSLLDDGKTWELTVTAVDNDGWFKIAPDFAYEKPSSFFDNLLCAPYDGCEELSGNMEYGNLGAWHLPQSDLFHSYTIRIIPLEMTYEIVPITIEKPNKIQIWQDPQTKVNYVYTVGESTASVKEGSPLSAGSPEATGNVTILSKFTVDGNEYSVTRIGGYAFYGCSGIHSVIIPESVTGIGENAFIGTAWYNKQPYGIVYLDDWALGHNCFSIQEDVFIKKGTKGIGDYSFCNTDIINVTMPESMAIIGAKAFEGCNKLEKVYCYSKNVPITSIDAFSNSSQQEAILCVPTASLNDYKNSVPWSEFSIFKGIEGKDNLKPGDVNGDEAIDVADIASVIAIMASNESVNMTAADINKDGVIDVADIATIINIMAAGNTGYEYCTFEEDGMEGILTESGLYALLQYTPDRTGCIFTNGNIHDDTYSCILIDSLGFVKGVKTTDNRTYVVVYTPNELWLIDSDGNVVSEIPYSEFDDKEEMPNANRREVRKAWEWKRSPIYNALSIGHTIMGYLENAKKQAFLDLLYYLSGGIAHQHARHAYLLADLVILGLNPADIFAWIDLLEKLEEIYYFGSASLTALDAIPYDYPCSFVTPCMVEGLSTDTQAFRNLNSRYEELLNFSFDLKMTAQTSAIPHTERKFLTANIPSNGTYDDFVFDFNELQTMYDYEPSLTLNMTIKRLSSEYDGAMIYYYDPLATNKYHIIQRSCTIYGKPNHLVTGSVSSTVEKVINPKATSADIICSFSDVPKGAKCIVLVSVKGSDFGFQYDGNPGVKSQTVKATNLSLNTKYVASTYISNNGRYYYGIDRCEFTTTAPTGTVISVDEATITTTSAVANCKFTDIESEVECGVKVYSSTETHTFPASGKNGEEPVLMTGLTPGTTYNCYAYVKGPNYSHMNTGGVEFTTKPPVLAGTWYCTEYANDGSVFETSTLELSSDGHAVATTTGGTAWFTSAKGDWKYNRVGADGFVNVSVIHETSSGSWSAKNFDGKVDNLENPSRVEGTATRSSGSNMGGGDPYVYKLIMTR